MCSRWESGADYLPQPLRHPAARGCGSGSGCGSAWVYTGCTTMPRRRTALRSVLYAQLSRSKAIDNTLIFLGSFDAGAGNGWDASESSGSDDNW
jgi:hypothetical protein